MKEIKFRAWLGQYWAPPAGKTMAKVIGLVCITLGAHDPEGKPIKGRGWTIVFEDWTGQHETVIPESHLMQYTGLHDKNGKEIYEGDILRWPDKETDVVFWCVSGAAFVIGVCQTLYDCEPEKNSEVIGNTYENKELLK